MKDYAIDPITQDYTISSGRPVMRTDILNNIYFSLMTQLGTFPFDKTLGSKLHLLTRMKALPRVEALAKEYCEQALQWIIDAGRATNFDIEIELQIPEVGGETKRLACRIIAYQSGQEPTIYTHFVEVR